MVPLANVLSVLTVDTAPAAVTSPFLVFVVELPPTKVVISLGALFSGAVKKKVVIVVC